MPAHPFDPSATPPSASLRAFGRYESFTDLSALNAATERPLRKSVRVNTLKCSIADFQAWAKEQGWSLTPVPWWPEGFFIERTDLSVALGRDIRHLLGHFYMQEAASMLPVALLDPQLGESILDLCAAPGSKTMQIAVSLQGRGVVVANDMQEKRLRVLNDALQRTGATTVVITRKTGQWFSKHLTERFDRVVCDAPCTAQGTARKDPTALQYSSMDSIAKAARLQYQLLEAAVHAAKVGGRIVYSTCTLTPEENEGVALGILNKFSDQLEVVHPKEALTSGLKWDMSAAISDSETVQKSLNSHANLHPFLRLWPQTYDTEGFFCAVFKKVKRTREIEPLEMFPRAARPLIRKQSEAVSRLFTQQFGTDFLVPGECLAEKGNYLLLVAEDAHAFPLPVTEYATGVPYAKVLPDGRFRVANEIVSLRGHFASAQVMELSEAELTDLLAGKDLQCDATLHGDTVLRFQNIALGLGLAKEGTLLNRLPRWIVKLGGRG